MSEETSASGVNIMAILEQAGCIYDDGHFVLTSGKHSAGYINFDPILPDVYLVDKITRQLVQPFLADGFNTIAAPATGGIVLATLAALYVTKAPTLQNANLVWADKDGDDFVFKRSGFAARLKNRRVLVVDDIISNGTSVGKVCRAAEALGATIVGVGALCTTGNVNRHTLHVPRFACLGGRDFPSVVASKCTLCRAGEPIVEDIGHGAKYKAEHPDYAGGYIALSAA